MRCALATLIAIHILCGSGLFGVIIYMVMFMCYFGTVSC